MTESQAETMRRLLDMEEIDEDNEKNADKEGEASVTETGMVLWQEPVSGNLFTIEPAMCLDAFPGQLMVEFVSHIRDIVKWRRKWDDMSEENKRGMATTAQQRYAPGKGTP